MLNLQQQLKLGLKLTPQQIQYLKLLQLPTLALEQRVKLELELNPMLEQADDMELLSDLEEPPSTDETNAEDNYSLEDYLNDDLAGHKAPEAHAPQDEESYEPPIASTIPITERLLAQFRLSNADEEDQLLAEEILGNVDTDGYLRRNLQLVVDDLNLTYGLSIPTAKAEQVLQKIQLLDPPGIASRTLQECLRAQLKSGPHPQAMKELAYHVLDDWFEEFKLKRYDLIAKKLHVSVETMKKVVSLIQHLNPKPGEGEFSQEENYVTPDFIVEKDGNDFLITLNDRNIPTLRINNAYRDIVMPKKKGASAEAKDFVKKKFESAKWFISSIHQRRETLLRIMRAIVEAQRQWFEDGEVLRPLIYREISDVVGADISTISRVVKHKFVQTEFGVFSLRYFFTSAIKSDSGEDISNLMVKQHVRDIIEAEDNHKPLNDDSIAEMLQKEGVHIARRTVAKYREQLNIPIARMRKKY
ncbi:MAG: RNA polymerase factor sigma-54 [Ignavibacteriales bacterium]|nr:RNA polymerase factor sigma-54 [Ignavibacteriales bacterium]